MSSKARYYLEQCIPEVDDLIEKGLFTKPEVNKIMKKRTDFEHRLASRGSSINDYIRYIDYENNVDKLRSKRVKRLLHGSKKYSLSDYSIHRRIEFIFKRGTQKFPKNLKFWSLYLNYLKSRGNKISYKKIHTVYNELLRLHPTNAEIWVSCAKYEYERYANFNTCRTVFQNALRFNHDNPQLWIEYFKFELNFVTKLINRRKVMDLINEREQEMDMLNEKNENLLVQDQKTGKIIDDNDSSDDEEGMYRVQAPSTGDSMKDKLHELPEVNVSMLGTQQTNPALKGDIALTIYQVAMKQLYEVFMNKQLGLYAHEFRNVDAHKSDKLRRQEIQNKLDRLSYDYLSDLTQQYVSLVDQFSDLNREYLINSIINFYNNNFSHDDPELMSTLLTLDIRYVNLENFDINALKNAIKKYSAFISKNKNKNLKLKVKENFTNIIKEKYLSQLEVSDPRVPVLRKIIDSL